MKKLNKASTKPSAKEVKAGPPKVKIVARLEKLLLGSGIDSIRPAKEISALITQGAFLLDVRTNLEAKKGIAPGAKHISLLRIKHHLQELPKDKIIVTYCGTGARAGKAKDDLEKAGFRVVNGGSYDGILKILGSAVKE